MSEVDEALLEAARLERGEDVLVLGDGELAFGVQERVGDGWVYVVRPGVDALEELLGAAHVAGTSGLAYLVGELPVLPLPDGAVAAALGWVAADAGAVGAAAAAAELARVVPTGGRVALAGPDRAAGEGVAAALGAAGFGGVEVAEVANAVVISGSRE